MADLLINSHLVFQIVQVAVIIIASFILVKIFNQLILRVAEERIKTKKRILVNVQRFLQLIVFSVASILIFVDF